MISYPPSIYSMQPEDNTDSSLVAALAEADGQVREMVACVEHQRQLIWDLAEAGLDVCSAQIVLDSLLFSVFLWVQERQRLYSVLHARSTEATAAA